MKMTLDQTRLVGLTMQLDLKTREFKMLCEELDSLKGQGLDPNAEEFAELEKKFVENNKEIKEINRQLKELKENN